MASATHFEESLKRLELLRGHVNPTDDAIIEKSKATFDVDIAWSYLWELLPPLYFQSFEAISKLPWGVFRSPMAKSYVKTEMRKDTNEFLINFVNKMYELGFTTPEKVANNID